MSNEFKYQLSVQFGPAVGPPPSKDKDFRKPAAMLNVRAVTADEFHAALVGIKGAYMEQAILDVVKKYGGALVTAGSFPPPPQFTPDEAHQPTQPGDDDETPAGPKLNEERLTVQNLDISPTKNPKYIRYSAKFSNGTRAGTIVKEHGQILREAYGSQKAVFVSFVQNGDYTNIGTVRLA